MKWWHGLLKGDEPLVSRFWDVQPEVPLVCSDASGEDGWGACLMGIHVVGPWPDEWRQSKGSGTPHMLFKELVAPTMAVSLVAPFLRGQAVACALDNAGVAFTLNSLSSGCAMTLQLLRHLADSLSWNQLGLVAGHAHRHRNQHADALSHSLTVLSWQRAIATAKKAKTHRMELHFAVLDVKAGEAYLATMSFAKPYADCATKRGAKGARR